MKYMNSEAEYKEFKPRHLTTKIRFQLSAGRRLEAEASDKNSLNDETLWIKIFGLTH